jgi:hypothetical protein
MMRRLVVPLLAVVLTACGGAPPASAPAPEPDRPGLSWNDSLTRASVGRVLRTEFGRLPANRRAIALGCAMTVCRGVDSVVPTLARTLRLRVVSRADSLFDGVGRRKVSVGASTLLPDCGRNAPTWALASVALVPKSDTAPERMRVDVYRFNARAWCTGTLISTYLQRDPAGAVTNVARLSEETTLESR